MTDDVGPSCECDIPSVKRQVQKEGANKGRFFYTCAKNKDMGPCKFFQWADQAARSSPTKRPYKPYQNKPYKPPVKQPPQQEAAVEPSAQPTPPLAPQPDPPHKKAKLVRCGAVGDIDSLLQTWDNKFNQLGCATIQKNTHGVERLTSTLEETNRLLNDVKANLAANLLRASVFQTARMLSENESSSQDEHGADEEKNKKTGEAGTTTTTTTTSVK